MLIFLTKNRQYLAACKCFTYKTNLLKILIFYYAGFFVTTMCLTCGYKHDINIPGKQSTTNQNQKASISLLIVGELLYEPQH